MTACSSTLASLALLALAAPLRVVSGATLRGAAAWTPGALEPVTLCGYNYRKHGMEWNCGECGSRERQSPLNFGPDAPWGPQNAKLGNDFWFAYEPLVGDFPMGNLKNGTDGTLMIDVSARGLGGITLHNNMFNMKSIEFHAQSEHTFRGKRLPMEMHIRHVSEVDTAHELVVAILFDPLAPPNPPATAALAALKATVPPKGGGHVTLQVPAPSDLINPLVVGGTYFMYTGSNTAPPCREQTTWLVRQEPLHVTDEAYILRSQMVSANDGNENWRGVMPLMGRLISTMLAKQGVPPLTTDSNIPPGQAPPVGKLGGHTGTMVGEHIGREAFAMGGKATAVAQGIYNAMANPPTVLATPPGAPGPRRWLL